MSSEDDDDLKALRTAVLSSIRGKKQPSPGGHQIYDTDIDDLEALRSAALKTKIKPTNNLLPVPFGAKSNSAHLAGSVYQPRLPVFRIRPQVIRPQPRSNLIVIRTVPEEREALPVPSAVLSSVLPQLILPQDRYTSSASVGVTEKTKRNDKWSRFDKDCSSDSESETDDEEMTTLDEVNSSQSEDDSPSFNKRTSSDQPSNSDVDEEEEHLSSVEECAGSVKSDDSSCDVASERLLCEEQLQPSTSTEPSDNREDCSRNSVDAPELSSFSQVSCSKIVKKPSVNIDDELNDLLQEPYECIEFLEDEPVDYDSIITAAATLRSKEQASNNGCSTLDPLTEDNNSRLIPDLHSTERRYLEHSSKRDESAAPPTPMGTSSSSSMKSHLSSAVDRRTNRSDRGDRQRYERLLRDERDRRNDYGKQSQKPQKSQSSYSSHRSPNRRSDHDRRRYRSRSSERHSSDYDKNRRRPTSSVVIPNKRVESRQSVAVGDRHRPNNDKSSLLTGKQQQRQRPISQQHTPKVSEKKSLENDDNSQASTALPKLMDLNLVSVSSNKNARSTTPPPTTIVTATTKNFPSKRNLLQNSDSSSAAPTTATPTPTTTMTMTTTNVSKGDLRIFLSSKKGVSSSANVVMTSPVPAVNSATNAVQRKIVKLKNDVIDDSLNAKKRRMDFPITIVNDNVIASETKSPVLKKAIDRQNSLRIDVELPTPLVRRVVVGNEPQVVETPKQQENIVSNRPVSFDSNVHVQWKKSGADVVKEGKLSTGKKIKLKRP